MATAVTRPAEKPVVLLAGFDAPEVAACRPPLRQARLQVAEAHPGARAPAPSGHPPGHPLARRTLEVARRLAAQRDLPSCCELLKEAAAELAGADRADALLYDRASETLWSREPGLGAEERRESAA